MKSKINIGIIGCGWIVEFAHIPSLLEYENLNIKAVFDIDIKKAERLKKEFPIEYAFDNIEEFFLAGIDAVIVASPNFTHAGYTIEALKRGIHVLCEKPVALHYEDVKEIISVSKKNNAVYVPGFVNRWRQDVSKIQEIVESGSIGDVKSINAGWIRRNGIPRPGTWFTNKKLSGGGVLVDLGSHILDICLMLFGNKKAEKYSLIASSVNCEKIKENSGAVWFKSSEKRNYSIDVEDTAIADIDYTDGSLLHVELSWLSQVNGDYTYFDIKGSKGTIKLRTLFGFSNEGLFDRDYFEIKCNEKSEIYYFDKNNNNAKSAFKEMLGYFINSIYKNETESVNYYDALKNVEAIENLYDNQKNNINGVHVSNIKY